MPNPLEKLADSHNDVANKGCLDLIADDLKTVGIFAIIAIVAAVALCGPLGLGLSASQPLPEIDQQSLRTFAQIAFSTLTKGGFLGLVA